MTRTNAPHEPVVPASQPGPAPATPGAPARRALVLGGGGSTGNAWLIGVVAGLAEAGTDAAAADLTIGTSAGATCAAQLAGAPAADLLAAVLAAAPPTGPGPTGPGPTGAAAAPPVADQLARLRATIAMAHDQADLRRRLGADARERERGSDGSWSVRWRRTVAARLPGARWPARRLLITAVDAVTGDPVVFDRHSGVDLVDAVAASCASGLPYRIGERRFLDGGYRTNAENADLAAGCARVLVLSPFGGRSLTPPEWGTRLAGQIDRLRAGGSRVETICPTAEDEHLFGVRAMDLSRRPAAARSGLRQGRTAAARLAGFWE